MVRFLIAFIYVSMKNNAIFPDSDCITLRHRAKWNTRSLQYTSVKIGHFAKKIVI